MVKIKSSGGWAGGFEQGLVQVKTVKVMEAKEKVFFFLFFLRRVLNVTVSTGEPLDMFEMKGRVAFQDN